MFSLSSLDLSKSDNSPCLNPVVRIYSTLGGPLSILAYSERDTHTLRSYCSVHGNLLRGGICCNSLELWSPEMRTMNCFLDLPSSLLVSVFPFYFLSLGRGMVYNFLHTKVGPVTYISVGVVIMHPKSFFFSLTIEIFPQNSRLYGKINLFNCV